MNQENNILNRYEKAGLKLLGFVDIGLPISQIRLKVLTRYEKPIPPIEEFVLKSIEAGLNTEKDISGFLGLELNIVRDALANLFNSQDIDLIATDFQQQKLKLTNQGQRTIKSTKMIIPEERSYKIYFDRLLTRPCTCNKTLLSWDRNLKDEGIILIEPLIAKSIEIDDLDRTKVSKILKEDPDIKMENRDLLYIKTIEWQDLIYQKATAIVYEKESQDNIDDIYAIDFFVGSRNRKEYTEQFEKITNLPRKRRIIKSIVDKISLDIPESLLAGESTFEENISLDSESIEEIPYPNYQSSSFFEKGRIHKTKRGETVRSKSEVIIADALASYNINYVYEKDLIINNQRKSPDFTIQYRGVTYYWEHLGMLNDSEYSYKWEKKKNWYRKNDILPYKEGVGKNGVLILSKDDYTNDSPYGSIDSQEIHQLIEEIFVKPH
ncbi:hypothetical protein H6G25_12145 [Dolichospermum sp. FACHB-1091]|uniref:hypothetical protein n=1 Tax=Dolichospermum sp. FACHB-1091 TaxID=2692798 RepID=UPI0016808AC6|nr:hypothetical protein [Dolichospermum sp. FACHB-1091]MBD2443924.1 hypothetical protein [Dolichospermum sp. FACHB-1091]